MLTGKGILTYSASLIAASVKILPESATPDVQISFAPGSFKDGQIGQLEAEPGLTGGPWQMRPLSRGYVEAQDQPPRRRAGDQPALPDRGERPARDRRRAAATSAGFSRRRRWQPYVGEERLPGTQVQSDDELLDYAKRNGNTVYHASCTCMMGPQANCVVDERIARARASRGCASSTPR